MLTETPSPTLMSSRTGGISCGHPHQRKEKGNPISAARPGIQTPDILGKVAACVMTGAGIVSVPAASWLARAGQEVVLPEKGAVGAEQPGRNRSSRSATSSCNRAHTSG